MKRLVLSIAGLGVAVAIGASGAEREGAAANPPPGDRDGARAGVLTEEQAREVGAILARYDAAALTAEQARAIHEALRRAGLRAGPAMGDAIRKAGFDPERLRQLAPPPSGPRGGDGEEERPEGRGPSDRSGAAGNSGAQGDRGHGGYSIAQAVSDRAQLTTIAFSGLAFLTGDFGASTFLPPGKVCDFFGFQYMRDIDAAGKGHNPAFLNRVAGNVLHVLDDTQRKLLEDLAAEQAVQFEQLALKRMPLILAFHRELAGDIPTGCPGLSREAVVRYTGDLFAFDAELSYRRAEVFGRVASLLTPDQKAYLAQMKFGDFSTWPELDERDQLKRPEPGASRFHNVACMTYASEFFSWYAGSAEADAYFCPERHGTYFGGFFMKDMPAMGKRDYDIGTSITGDRGEAFMGLLTGEQRGLIASVIERQRSALAEIVEVRRAIVGELRRLLGPGQADRAKVAALGRRYGELDGELSWMYATAFAGVGRSLTAEQRAACARLRGLEGYRSAPAYMYSQPLAARTDVPDTAFLFVAAAPAHAAGGVAAAGPASAFVLRSPVVTDGGVLPAAYTGDGQGVTLPLEWTGAPAGTKSFAVVMHHIDPEGKIKWYWVLYNIPGDAAGLPENVAGVGVAGNNSINGKAEYAPPHSTGPGPKTYVCTVYALSAPLERDDAAAMGRDALLAATAGRVLASAEMSVTYARPGHQ